MGRDVEALVEMRKAESLDPLSLIISTDLADALCIARRVDDSIRQSRKALELDVNFALVHVVGKSLSDTLQSFHHPSSSI
jgi:hypothetical protein